MTVRRYDDRKIAVNKEELYETTFEERGVDYIRQYKSPNMTHPTAKQIRTLENMNHVWVTGDRFYKLADRYYGNVRYWWIIAWYNRKPTESHVTLGEVLKVPFPVSKVLKYLRG